eukprot:TRINITY_DN883_c0_g1_i1.p2 TRINITY_DN883_c0_g1~~TRINITY_DN883_c0_g1_i1.p2  ORF type:complete len:180 (+),score=44.59 TRINITY_DN883_c0_g1_i1:34-540(+)
MHLFDPNGNIKKYSSAEAIIQDYFAVRLEGYRKRYEQELDIQRQLVNRLENQRLFANLVIRGDLRLSEPSTDEDLHSKMVDLGLRPLDENDKSHSFRYLLDSPISVLTAKNVERLSRALDEAKKELSALEKKTAHGMWQNELASLRALLLNSSDFDFTNNQQIKSNFE